MVADNFIEKIIENDLSQNNNLVIQTRFPPEPNGYLHIGHLKSMVVNFGIKEKYNGKCNLFFDDTNPNKEKLEYETSIIEDLNWLEFKYDKIVHASDFYDQIYNFAVQEIKLGNAYVCDLSPEEISQTRGTFNIPGTESPYRNRTIEENLLLFEQMKNGKYADGEKCLRAKIDMNSNNINMRDPVIYRILHTTHYRTLDKWCIYPTYDFAHPICDYLQGVTHSICTLEFEDHRKLYDWVGITLQFKPKPQQIEFARLNITNLIMSKRYLRKLVENHCVDGWDDPVMPTLKGIKNRGIPIEALKEFCKKIGVSKANSEIEIEYFEEIVRDYLFKTSKRSMCVINPIKVSITNFDNIEHNIKFDTSVQQDGSSIQNLTFSNTIYISGDDFALMPPKKYNRLVKGGYVRLKSSYIIKCNDVVCDNNGKSIELLCEYIKNSKSGNDTSNIKVKGTIQWVCSQHAKQVNVVDYDHLLNKDKDKSLDIIDRINKKYKKINTGLMWDYDCEYKDIIQFIRVGYYKLKNDNTLIQVMPLKNNYNIKNINN